MNKRDKKYISHLFFRIFLTQKYELKTNIYQKIRINYNLWAKKINTTKCQKNVSLFIATRRKTTTQNNNDIKLIIIKINPGNCRSHIVAVIGDNAQPQEHKKKHSHRPHTLNRFLFFILIGWFTSFILCVVSTLLLD